MTSKVPRGIRNNNPLNIVKSKSKWQGLAEEQTDPRFCVFTSMPYGLRAALVLLRKYINKYGCNTVRKIIIRWSPDGHERAYIHFVACRLGITPAATFAWSNQPLVKRLVMAMALFECGQQVDESDIDAAFEML